MSKPEERDRGAGRVRGGGGIVFGAMPASTSGGTGQSPLVRSLRQRWASSVAIVTALDERDLRGVTVSALMVVSEEPPVFAIALTLEQSFHRLLMEGARCIVHLLDADDEAIADRFAGRGPVPDGAFRGVPHVVSDNGLPWLEVGSMRVQGLVVGRTDVGDHALVTLTPELGDPGDDRDDPLITFEGRYRHLDVG